MAAVLLVLVQAPAARAADTGPWALFDGSPAIADPDADESINVELGTRFSVTAPASGAYWLTKVRYGGGFPTASWAASSYYVSPLVALDT